MYESDHLFCSRGGDLWYEGVPLGSVRRGIRWPRDLGEPPEWLEAEFKSLRDTHIWNRHRVEPVFPDTPKHVERVITRWLIHETNRSKLGIARLEKWEEAAAKSRSLQAEVMGEIRGAQGGTFQHGFYAVRGRLVGVVCGKCGWELQVKAGACPWKSNSRKLMEVSTYDESVDGC